MEGIYFQSDGQELSNVEKSRRRLSGRLLDMLIDRAVSGEAPKITREEAISQVKDLTNNLPALLAALDLEIERQHCAIDDEWLQLQVQDKPS